MSDSHDDRIDRYEALQAEYPEIDESEYRKISRRSLLVGGAGWLAGLFGWNWLQSRPDDNRIPYPLRRGHELNETIWSALFRGSALAPTFDPSESSMLRVNGRHGLDGTVLGWSMNVLDRTGGTLGTHVLSDIQALPKYEMTVEHKCVEGWSHIVTWGGVQFSEFVASVYPAVLEDPTAYVGLVTPDGEYYVGLEWEAMMHPQTLLCYELQGELLNTEHGAPLRLVTPLKYGIKQLKRIGTIEFTDAQPADYWHERGYDYYSAL